MSKSYNNPSVVPNVIGTSQIVDDSVTAADIAANAVTSSELADNSVDSAAIIDSAIGTNDVGVDALGAADLAAGSVGTSEVADGTLAAADLATGAALGNIAADTITSTQIGVGAVGTSEVADGTLAAADLATGAALGNIAADTITSTQIGVGAVGTSEVADGTIASADILDGGVASADILDGTITSTDILDATITAADFAPGAVGTASVTDGSITEAKAAPAQAFTATGTIVASGGDVVALTPSAAAQTFTAPAATSGLAFQVVNLSTANACTLQRAGTDTIAGLTSITIPAGGRYLLTCTATGAWIVTTLVKPIVTALPIAAPFDGMEIRYQTSAMATAGAWWTLRYNAGSASGYKWEYVEGASLVDNGANGNVSTAGAFTFAAINADQAVVTVPRDGDYVLSYSGSLVNQSSGNLAQGVLAAYRTSVGALMYAYYDAGTVLNMGTTAAVVERRIDALAGGNQIEVQCGTAGGITVQVVNPTITLRPVRLQG